MAVILFEHASSSVLIADDFLTNVTVLTRMLDLSKIEAGYMTVQKEKFVLTDVLDDVLGMFRLRAEKKKL